MSSLNSRWTSRRRAVVGVVLAGATFAAMGGATANHDDPTGGLACSLLTTPVDSGIALMGQGPGRNDPLWTVEAGPGVAQPRPAVTINNNPAWIAAPAGTSWIAPQRDANLGGPVGTWILSVKFFVDPVCAVLGGLEFSFAVDNTVTWHLDNPNAAAIGGWTVVSVEGFNQFHAVDHHGVPPGLHTLYGRMGNAGGPLGLLVANGPAPLLGLVP